MTRTPLPYAGPLLQLGVIGAALGAQLSRRSLPLSPRQPLRPALQPRRASPNPACTGLEHKRPLPRPRASVVIGIGKSSHNGQRAPLVSPPRQGRRVTTRTGRAGRVVLRARSLQPTTASPVYATATPTRPHQLSAPAPSGASSPAALRAVPSAAFSPIRRRGAAVPLSRLVCVALAPTTAEVLQRSPSKTPACAPSRPQP